MASSREDTARPGGASGTLNRFMQALAAPFVSVMQRWMPDPFIFATLLTALTFVLCVVIAEYPPASTVGARRRAGWRERPEEPRRGAPPGARAVIGFLAVYLACAVSGAALVCWGDDRFGQLGDPSRSLLPSTVAFP